MDRRKDHTLVLDMRRGAEVSRLASAAYAVLANFNVRRLSFLVNGRLVTCEPKDALFDIQKRIQESFPSREKPAGSSAGT
ncbi:MAG: hypothetical protein NVS9B14_21480 [Candidatus Acidiferrum sp.]